MNIKKNNLSNKTFFYFVIFSIVILLFLWSVELIFIKVFYQKYQIKDVKTVGTTILNIDNNNLISYLEEVAYKKDMCIELYSSNQIYNFNTSDKDCSLKSNDLDIIKAKRKLKYSSNNETLIKLSDSKTIIYGVRVNNDTYVILNTKINDVGTTNYILRSQLIYITLIVIIIALLASYYVSKMLNKPILEITNKARKMANGNFEMDTNNYEITELDELKDVLNYARSEIKNTDTLRRDLMANVSHDLKTPLTMIKAYAEMAKDLNNNNEAKRKENLDIIISETDRLNILVNDILDLSKMQSGNQKLNYEEYDLIEEIKQIIKKYEIIKETENYKFILNTPAIAIVKADKKQINQVLYNLINNAINYTGNDLTIIINVKENKNNFLVEIIDSGKGLTKEECKLIWNKYYKNEKNHKRNKIGTGLGLSIVQTILTKHNFTYGVKSEIGKGSNFYFKIKK